MNTYEVLISYEAAVKYRVRATSAHEAEEIGFERFSKSHPVTDGELMGVAKKVNGEFTYFYEEPSEEEEEGFGERREERLREGLHSPAWRWWWWVQATRDAP